MVRAVFINFLLFNYFRFGTMEHRLDQNNTLIK